MRNQTIELLRIVAAFGIVVFHSGAPGAEIGYSGLITFMVLTTMFEAESERIRPITSLAKRLLLPWVFWSVIYISVRWVATGYPFHERMNPLQSVLYGDHLWFLPFAFIALVVVGILRRFDVPLAPFAAGATVVLLLLAEPLRNLTNTAPMAQWLHIAPAIFIGIALTSIVPAGVVALAVLYAFSKQVPGVSIPYAIGVGSVIFARHMVKIRINVEPISSCMFGVYLVHLFALTVANRITGQGTLPTAILAFFGALCFVYIGRRYIRPVLG